MNPFRTAYGVTRLVWSPDDAWLAYVRDADEAVVCVEAETGREVFAWDPPRFWRGVFVAAVSAEALLVVTRAKDDVRVFAVAVPDGGVLAEARFDAAPGDLAVEVSADGATAAVLSGLTNDAKGRGYELTWLDTRSLTVVGRGPLRPAQGDRPKRMALHPDGLWATWLTPQQSARYDDRREVERFDRAGAAAVGPVFGGSGDLKVLRWVDADRLLVTIDPVAANPSAGWTRLLLTDPSRGRVLFDGEKEAGRVGVSLVYSEVDVHPEDGRLLVAWTDRLAEVDQGSSGTATVLGRDGAVLAGWRTPTAFSGCYGAVWAGAGDAVIELVAEGEEAVALTRREAYGEAPTTLRAERLQRPKGARGWGESGRGVTGTLTRSPRGRWVAVTWTIGRYAAGEQVSWVAAEG
ncbi:MAG: hypothetical protein JWM10_1638 [Myxococcaceae bacterium]|nr:hypothetical protein [Myxococcaceae bacterium]